MKRSEISKLQKRVIIIFVGDVSVAISVRVVVESVRNFVPSKRKKVSKPHLICPSVNSRRKISSYFICI